jgi:hypothetical protein
MGSIMVVLRESVYLHQGLPNETTQSKANKVTQLRALVEAVSNSIQPKEEF